MLNNSLRNNRSLDWSSLKAFADNKINVTQKFEYVYWKVENIVGKGENAGYQHFILFTTMFWKGFFLRVVKSWDRVGKS